MSDIIFVVQQLSQPRCLKRISEFQNLGKNIRVFGFDNGLYNDNLKYVEVEEAWEIDKRTSRFFKFLKYIFLVLAAKRKSAKSDIFYVFGFELGLVVSFFRPRNFIYEEADISASRIKNVLIRKALISLDRRIIQKSLLTVFTSGGFVSYLFGNVNPPKNKIVYAYNKLHPSFLHRNRPVIKKISTLSINFGFIGLIRYPNTILRFAKVVGDKFPQHSFHFWGDVEGDSLNFVDWSIYDNIFFHGRFSNPEDLVKVYSFIDINVVCYDTTSDNVKIAEPNKLYESIYFKKPIVVSSNTYLSRRVNDMKSGYDIDASSDWGIIEFIDNLNDGELQSIQFNCENTHVSDLVTDSKSFLNEVFSRI